MKLILCFILLYTINNSAFSQERTFYTSIVKHARKQSDNKWEWSYPKNQNLTIRINNNEFIINDSLISYLNIKTHIATKEVRRKNGIKGNVIGFNAYDSKSRKCTLEIQSWEDGVFIYYIKYNDAIFKYICSQ
jgi:hypothetical protein